MSFLLTLAGKHSHLLPSTSPCLITGLLPVYGYVQPYDSLQQELSNGSNFRAGATATSPLPPDLHASPAGVMEDLNVILIQELCVLFEYMCQTRTQSSQGVPPATVAEWTLQGSGNFDYYDGASSTTAVYPRPRKLMERI